MNLQDESLLVTGMTGECAMSIETIRSRTVGQDLAAGTKARPKLHPYALIFGCTTVLSLGIAIECRSIAHLPSSSTAFYIGNGGASSSPCFGRLEIRREILSKLSLKAGATHTVLATTLGMSHLLLLGSLSPVEQALHLERSLPGGITSLLTINRFGMEVVLYACACGMVATCSHRYALNGRSSNPLSSSASSSPPNSRHCSRR